MKTSNKILLGLFIAILIGITAMMLFLKSSLQSGGLSGDGNVKEIIREIGVFQELELQSRARVYITQDEKHQLRIVADSNIIPYIRTDIRGKALKIYSDTFIVDAERFDLYLSAKEINEIDLERGARLYTENQLQSETLELDISAGSKAEMTIHVNRLECSLSAGSKCELSGYSDFVDIDASAGSIVNAYHLTINECKVDASSGSMLKLNVKEKLMAVASSGSNIKYRGNPEVDKIDISSGANLEQAN